MNKINESFYDVFTVYNVQQDIREIMIKVHNQYSKEDRDKVTDELEDAYGHYVDPDEEYNLVLSVDSCKKLISILEEAIQKIEKK